MNRELLPVDTHIHTSLCKHAHGSPEEYVARGRASSMAAVCFCDHAPAPDGYDAANRMTMDDFPVYRRIVEQARKGANIEVLFGIEADYYPGCLDFQRAWLADQGFDLVLGSIHYIGDWPFDHPDHRSRWETCDVEAEWRRYFRLLGDLADAAVYDVVGHIDLPKKFGARPSEGAIHEMAGPALDRVAAAGMGIEINTAGLRKPIREIYPSSTILELAHRRSIPICFGSDAHGPSDVGADFKAAMKLARAAGYTQYARFRARKATFTPIPG